MSALRIERHELGPRLWVGRWRCHHFHLGAALIVVGVSLVWQDRRDIRRGRL